MTVPRVFGLPHLSEDAVAAFADGVLSDAATVRARKHCIECPECAQAVRVQRETAMMLRTASSPTMPAGLMDRLAGLPMSTPMPPPHSGLPTMLDADGIPVFVAHNPPGRKRPDAQPGAQSEPAPNTNPTAGPGNRAKPADKPQPNGHHRRVLVPVGILASAAAMVAAGTIGSTTTSTRQPIEPQQPVAVQPLVTNLVASQTGLQLVPVHRVLATSPRLERP